MASASVNEGKIVLSNSFPHGGIKYDVSNTNRISTFETGSDSYE